MTRTNKPKAVTTLVIMSDGSVREKGVNGPEVSWETAHGHITAGRKLNQKTKSEAAAARRAASKAKNADKIAAQIAAVEAKLAKLQKAA